MIRRRRIRVDDSMASIFSYENLRIWMISMRWSCPKFTNNVSYTTKLILVMVVTWTLYLGTFPEADKVTMTISFHTMRWHTWHWCAAVMQWSPLMILNQAARVRILSGGQYTIRLRSRHRAYPSLHPFGVVHWVPEQLNIKAVTGHASWLMVAALHCVRTHLQWHHLAYATEVNSTAFSASVNGLWGAQYVCRTFTFTFTYYEIKTQEICTQSPK